MQEEPNLSYIKEIAGGDPTYIQKLIGIIKKEFPEERTMFLNLYDSKDYLKAAELVHKLKHKINILGLEKGHENARELENQLREGKSHGYSKFISTLENIENYLARL